MQSSRKEPEGTNGAVSEIHIFSPTPGLLFERGVMEIVILNQNLFHLHFKVHHMHFKTP